MGRVQAIGMAWIYLHQYRSVDDELKAFEAVTLKSIREVLVRWGRRPRWRWGRWRS